MAFASGESSFNPALFANQAALMPNFARRAIAGLSTPTAPSYDGDKSPQLSESDRSDRKRSLSPPQIKRRESDERSGNG